MKRHVFQFQKNSYCFLLGPHYRPRWEACVGALHGKIIVILLIKRRHNTLCMLIWSYYIMTFGLSNQLLVVGLLQDGVCSGFHYSPSKHQYVHIVHTSVKLVLVNKAACFSLSFNLFTFFTYLFIYTEQNST